jgi:hypothetical protein
MRWLPLALILLQDPAIRLLPGEFTPKTWKIAGTADVPDDTELILGARRMERRWESRLSRFQEFPDDLHRMRAVADVKEKRFEAVLKAGPTGRYDLAVGTEEKVMFKSRLPLGAVESMFHNSIESVRRILVIADKSMACLEELERYADNPDDAKPKAREAFNAKTSALLKQIEGEWPRVDLTGTLRLLRHACHHILNAQVWESGPKPPGAENDPIGNRKGYFLDLSLTFGDLRKALSSAREVLSKELKVSIAGLLEGLYSLAGGTDNRRQETARAASRAAVKLFEAAPVPNPEFAKLLDRATDSDVEIGPLRDQLKLAADVLLISP